MSRRSGGRNQSRIMLILTEGPSEVEYFNMFRGRNRHVAVVPLVAKKHDPTNLIPYCDSKVYERGIDPRNGDSVSVVIDVDDRTDAEIMSIERQCVERGYGLYLSKRSFECWLILHFRKLTRAMTQEELESELSNCIGRRYRKSEGICKTITEESVRSAIERAERIISDEAGRNIECMHHDPSTAVHFLVKRSWMFRNDHGEPIRHPGAVDPVREFEHGGRFRLGSLHDEENASTHRTLRREGVS